jgi:hypothetical protein
LAGNRRAFNENAAWAVLITNVHRRKKKDVAVTVMADATAFLVRKYGSYDVVAKEAEKHNFKFSREMVRNFYDISRLDRLTKRIVREQGIGIDVARRLRQIDDLERRHETANAILDLDSFTARAVIEYITKSPRLSVRECKRRILAQKTERIEVNALVIPLDANEYTALKKIASDLGLDVTEAARRAVHQMIHRKREVNRDKVSMA